MSYQEVVASGAKSLHFPGFPVGGGGGNWKTSRFLGNL